jgi:hypothetical protein
MPTVIEHVEVVESQVMLGAETWQLPCILPRCTRGSKRHLPCRVGGYKRLETRTRLEPKFPPAVVDLSTDISAN